MMAQVGKEVEERPPPGQPADEEKWEEVQSSTWTERLVVVRPLTEKGVIILCSAMKIHQRYVRFSNRYPEWSITLL